MDKKPVVPTYIDTWIQGCKYNGFDLLEAMTLIDGPEEIGRWISDNPETFAKAWLYDYEVEKEKLYLASFRDTNQYLGWNEKLGEWFMSGSPFTSCVEQTQETWEGVGIWNNPAFEIKEVKRMNNLKGSK